MKLIIELTESAPPQNGQRTFTPSWRVEGEAQLITILQAIDWVKGQILSMSLSNPTPPPQEPAP